MKKTKDELYDWLWENFGVSGRMINGSKQSPKGHECVWNANICTKRFGKIWFGDIDLTTDKKKLTLFSEFAGEEIFVLRESDARFKNESTPKFENAVAVFSS